MQGLRRAAGSDDLLPAGPMSLMELHQGIADKHLETKKWLDETNKVHDEISSMLARAGTAPDATRNAGESSSGLFMFS